MFTPFKSFQFFAFQTIQISLAKCFIFNFDGFILQFFTEFKISFTKCKFDLEICGGTFVDEPCVVDGNLVSGRTFHDNGQYFGKFIELLEEQG